MPATNSGKPEKKPLKTVKSHYAHETRKDVDLRALASLKLDSCWPLIRREIEAEIGAACGGALSGGGGAHLVCVPFISEAQFYEITCAFTRAGDVDKPAGRLLRLLDEPRCDRDYVEWLRAAHVSGAFLDADYRFPHESVKITLQDDESKNKVRVIMMNMFRLTFPKDKSPVGKIRLKKSLTGIRTFSMITDVLMAKTVEFRANQGSDSRIFHLGDTAPLVFSCEKFHVDEEGNVVGKVENCEKEINRVFSRADTLDRLYTHPGVDNLETNTEN